MDLIFFCTALDWSQPRDIITSKNELKKFHYFSGFGKLCKAEREWEREIFGVRLTKLFHEIGWGEMVFRLLIQII